MMTSQTVKLSGRVTIDDGIYVVVVDGTNWCTYHSDGIQVLRDVPKMVVDYLNAYQQTGQIEPRLLGIGFDLPLASDLTIEIAIDVSAIFAPTALLTEQVHYSVGAGVSP